MSDKLELKVLFTAVDRFLRPVKNITEASRGASKALNEAKASMKGLTDQQKLIDKFKSTNKSLGINGQDLEKARAHIRDRLTQLAPIFLKNKYMLGEGFSMLDVAIAPLLWRLDFYGIDLSKNAAPLLKYAERIFSRPAYIEALTPSEKVMRK